MKADKHKYLEQIRVTIEVQNQVVSESQNFDEITKKAFINYSNQTRQITEEELTLTQLRSISSELLIFWRESISPEVEAFWTRLGNKNIDFERKDELSFALQKGRFRRVDQGIGARRFWNSLKNLDSVKNRFSATDIHRIQEIIEKDERFRLEILKKCLHKNSIPKTQYLKFGECMAYFQQCNLFGEYFGKYEMDKLHQIWKGFESE